MSEKSIKKLVYSLYTSLLIFIYLLEKNIDENFEKPRLFILNKKTNKFSLVANFEEVSLQN